MNKKKQELIIEKVLAEKFTRYMEKYSKLYKSLAEMIEFHIDKSEKNPLIIDFSSGPGLLSVELNRLIPGADIIGLDPSSHMLSIAKNKLIDCKHCYLIKAGVENIPLKNNIADIIVSRFGVSSWMQPKQGFLEIFKVLKPRGTLVLEVLNKEFPKWKLLLMSFHMIIKGAERKVIKYNFESYRNAYTIKQVRQFLIETGFTINKVEGNKTDWKFLIIALKK